MIQELVAQKVVVVIDEYDALVRQGSEAVFRQHQQHVLQDLIQWGLLDSSRVVLILISNFETVQTSHRYSLLDETNCQVLEFLPFTKEEIQGILRHRLGDTELLVEEKLLELLLVKVACRNKFDQRGLEIDGDLRIALHMVSNLFQKFEDRLICEDGFRINYKDICQFFEE